MKIGAGDTSGDIYSVVSAICLDTGIRQRVAQLNAVLALAPVNARVGDRSDQANRVVVLVTEQLDTRQAVSAEVEAIRTGVASQRRAGSNAQHR